MTSIRKKLTDGALAQRHLLSDSKLEAAIELLTRLAASNRPGLDTGHQSNPEANSQTQPESELETVRVLFADQHGVLRGKTCLLYTSPSPRDKRQSRMPSSA